MSAPLTAAAAPVSRTASDLVPSCSVLLKGTPLSTAVAADVVSVTVQQDVDLPGMFTIRLIDWDLALQRVTWSEPGWFDPGAPVEIQMGYVGRLATLLTGEVTGLELEIDAERAPMLVVRGYDRRHRLMRGQRTRSFVGVTDSGIAQRIATERGLASQATATTVRLEHVLQHNQTDLEFLTERARRIGYEVALDDRILLFRPRRRPRVPRVRLAAGEDLISFHPRLTTMGQTRSASVQGWNPAQPEQQLRGEVTHRPDPGSSAAFPGAVGEGTRTVLRPLADQSEAAAQAKGLEADTEPWRIEGSGVCIGHADLAAGETVRIDGLGFRFSGTYAVTSATHVFDPSLGYRTAFDVRRETE